MYKKIAPGRITGLQNRGLECIMKYYDSIYIIRNIIKHRYIDKCTIPAIFCSGIYL